MSMILYVNTLLRCSQNIQQTHTYTVLDKCVHTCMQTHTNKLRFIQYRQIHTVIQIHIHTYIHTYIQSHTQHRFIHIHKMCAYIVAVLALPLASDYYTESSISMSLIYTHIHVLTHIYQSHIYMYMHTHPYTYCTQLKHIHTQNYICTQSLIHDIYSYHTHI